MTVARLVTTDLRRSVQRIMPAPSFEESLVKLLAIQVRRNLLRYQAMDGRFRERYQTAFEQFRSERLGTEMNFEVEQDYFDWELAVTGIEEMREELKRLETMAR